MSKGNAFMGTLRGKIGDTVFYRAKGEQRTRAYVKNVYNPKSTRQMEQRTQLSNTLGVYRCLKTFMEGAFADKLARQSDYNAFVSRNLNSVKIYIPKEMAKAQGAVVAPYQVTSGSLPTIVVSGTGVGSVTNIAVPTGFVLDDTTTVAAFSSALIAANPTLRAGMQLTYLSIIQQNNPQTGFPVISANMFKMVLSTSDTRAVREFLPEYGVSIVNGFIGHGALYASGAFAWILSEKDASGKLNVSSQRLIVTSDTLYAAYSSAEASEKAVRSYNGGGELYLTPYNSEGSVVSGIAEVSSISIDGAVVVNNFNSEIAISNGDPIVINGTNLKSSSISIFTSGNTGNSDSQIISGAESLAEFATVVTETATRIDATSITDVTGVKQIAIVADGRIVLNLSYQYSGGGIEGI